MGLVIKKLYFVKEIPLYLNLRFFLKLIGVWGRPLWELYIAHVHAYHI